jgi:O-acetyl-ADP-ribose deacetylase (regulator of RNase III)
MYTTGGKLPAKYVIHTVGPVWRGGKKGEDRILANAYKNSLRLAEELGVRQIAFPNISTGIYGFPKERAADIAIRAVTEHLHKGSRINEVIFVCFDKENKHIYREKLGSDTLEIK